MAKRMKSKIQPAQMKLMFQLSDRGSTIPQNTFKTFYIDLSQCASVVNRRFYRQGLNWAVAGMRVSSSVESSLVVQKLPNTWVMSNAWEKGFRHWMEMNKQALESSESVRPKFLDFKVYADKNHHRIGDGDNLLPFTYEYEDSSQTATIHTAVPGEWEYSKFVIPTSGSTGAAADFEVIAVGASFPGAGASGNNAVSLIEGYVASRALPNVIDPNTPDDSDDVGPTATPENWLGALTNEGTDQDKQVLADMITENNLAPYPFEGDGTATDTHYPGGANQLASLETHSIELITATTIGGNTHIPGGNFPCGLIAIHYQPTGNSATAILEVDLVPGTHRGYLAEPMTEM